MTNIKKISISGSDYVDIEDKLDTSFTEGKSYQIQIIGQAYICEADTKPTDGGFKFGEKPFIYTHNNSKLWVRPVKPFLPIDINVAEGVVFSFLNINVVNETPVEPAENVEQANEL